MAKLQVHLLLQVLGSSILLTIFLLAIDSEAQESASTVSYLQECNGIRKCDRRAWLTCTRGSCRCKLENSMIFEYPSNHSTLVEEALRGTIGKCAVKAGERCKFATEQDIDGKPLFELLPCVRNSECDSDGICSCEPEFYETRNGTCEQMRKLNEPCGSGAKCSKSSGLECVDGLCQCDKSESVFEPSLGTCVGLAGSACKNFLCIENATCHKESCECKVGHFRNLKNRCVPKAQMLDKCSEDAECDKDYLSNTLLRCVNGTCGCDPRISVYATVKRSSIRADHYNGYVFQGYEGSTESLCAPKPGLSCVRSRCAPGSFCFYEHVEKYNQYFTFHEATARGICQCEPGMIVSDETGLCATGHQGVCTTSKECASGLACVNERCRCQFTSQLYMEDRGRCISRAEGPCRTTEDCGVQAQCRMIGGRGKQGHCKCDDGMVMNDKGGCETAYGMKCNATTVCDTIAGLACIDGTCDCTDFARYSKSKRKCQGFVGTICDGTTKDGCVQGAECVKEHEKLPPSCKCAKGWVENADYGCTKTKEKSNSVIQRFAKVF